MRRRAAHTRACARACCALTDARPPPPKKKPKAGRIAEVEGVSAISLHARTADQLYSPPADWGAIRRLVGSVGVPVIGNGDVFEAADAMRMLRETGGRRRGARVGAREDCAAVSQRWQQGQEAARTKLLAPGRLAISPPPPSPPPSGCAGVMVGRACLGRPWLFSETAAMLSGEPSAWPPPPPPRLGGVLALALAHLRGLAEWEGDERCAVLQMRKLVGCYLEGFDRPALRARLVSAQTLEDWEAAVAGAAGDDAPLSAVALRVPRLKGGGSDGRPARQRVSLPPGWLEGRDDDSVPDYLTGDACEG